MCWLLNTLKRYALVFHAGKPFQLKPNQAKQTATAEFVFAVKLVYCTFVPLPLMLIW